MSINNLSPINQQLIKNRVNQNGKTTVDIKNNSSTDTFVNRHKKQLITFGTILGGIGLTVGACVLAYNGKLGSKAQEFIENIFNKFKGKSKANTNRQFETLTSELEKGVKKFFDKDNKLVNDVRLEKGEAVVSANKKPFTGIMGTIDNKGRKITLEYKNGALKSSAIDGKLKKTYSTYEEELNAYLGKVNDDNFKEIAKENLPKATNMLMIKDVQEGTVVSITKKFGKIDNVIHIADENDAFANFKKIEFNTNGQPVKILKSNKGVVDIVEYYNDGKTKKLQIETLGEDLYKQIEFNLDGSINKEIVGNGVLFDFYTPDGIKVINHE